MELKIKDWIFDVDIGLNMEISTKQAEEHCECGYCRNYYETLDLNYPDIRPFLAKFGVDPEGPDELSPFEPTIYEASFIVNGKITVPGKERLYVNGVPVRILSSEDADMDTERPKPYFVLLFGLLELPWVLSESAEDVISPANEPEYLERMNCKLMKLMNETQIS